MKKKYYYKVYGLNVESDIEIKELILLNEDNYHNIDVYISIGTMPINIKNKISDKIIKEYKKNNMWFVGNNVATFNVINGNKIIIEPQENYNLKMLKIYLLGIAFSMILVQRDELSIHCGAIDINGKGVLIVGKSGAGKSTLVNAFREYGYKLICDDMCSIECREDGIIFINPSFPMQRIGNDIIEKFGYNKGDYEKIQLNREKYLIPVNNEFQENKVILKAIFELEVDDTENVNIKMLTGGDKMKVIMNSIFRGEIINHIGITPEYFKKCMKVAKSVPIYKMIRPTTSISTDEQIREIKKRLEV